MNRTLTPTCPHCKYEFDEEETWYSTHAQTGEVSTGDGDESTLICPNYDCKKEFDVICVHETKFEAVEPD